MPYLLVNGEWEKYYGTTSLRKLYYRATEARKCRYGSFYVYEYPKRSVTGIRINQYERISIPADSIAGVPKKEFPLEIVLEKRVTKPTNPKQLYGDKKPSLDQLPLTGQIAQWEAHQDGNNKYGFLNWRKNPVEARTYINAAIRHLQLYAHGEAVARDTSVQNLGAVMSCCAILIDAEAHGTLIDNREHSKVACDALHKAEEMLTHLRGMQEERDKTKRPAKSGTKKYSWRPYYRRGVPDLTGYDLIAVLRYNRDNNLYEEKVYKLDHSKPDTYGINWYEVEYWRRA